MVFQFSLALIFFTGYSFGEEIVARNKTVVSCPEITPNLVRYNRASSVNETLYGACANHAIIKPGSPDLVLTITCLENGNYTTHGECVCKPGYYLNEDFCKSCPENLTKSTAGNQACIHPGSNTIPSCGVLTSVCPCRKSFFRIMEDRNTPGSNCYGAGRVTRIRYSNHTDGSVEISWPRVYIKPGKQPSKVNYLVSVDSKQYEMSKLVLFLKSTNVTRIHKIEVKSQVIIGNETFVGEPRTRTITVHRDLYSKGIQFGWNYGLMASLVSLLCLVLHG